jgi:hemolysin activation/secretion protein
MTPAIPVERIDVKGSTVFSPEELQAAVAPFVGQSLTFEDLQAAADAVTQLYLNAGYITSEAIIPPQDIEDGIVRLLVIEGRIDEIRVEGTNRLTGYVERRVALAGTQPVNQIELERQLQQLQLDPLFDNVEASLRRGEAENSSILLVRVTEAPALSGSLALDTLSPPSVGEFRTGATLQLLNPLGLGDRLFASYSRSTTGGSNAYELGYLVPLNPRGGTLLLRATPSDYEITDPNQITFDLGLEGTTDQYTIQYRQPLTRSVEEEFALSLGYQYRDGSTLIGGLILPSTITSVLIFGQDYLKRDSHGVWGAESKFRIGTDTFDATNNPDPFADGQFLSWQGRVQRFQILSPDSQLLVRGNLQLTLNSLLGSEQFFVGGAQSVRGYYQNQRFGDNGFSLSVENRLTVLKQPDGEPLLRLHPFIDMGYVWNSRSDTLVSDQNFLLGTGLGVETFPLDDLTARLDFGVPLVTVDDLPGDPPSGLRVYFDIRYRF